MLIYLLVGLVLAGIGLTIYFLYKRPSKPTPHNTYYFCTYNENDEKSCNHDSGIKPSDATTATLCILKTEYNDGKKHLVQNVKRVMIGTHYLDMKEAKIISIDDLSDMHKVMVELP